MDINTTQPLTNTAYTFSSSTQRTIIKTDHVPDGMKQILIKFRDCLVHSLTTMQINKMKKKSSYLEILKYFKITWVKKKSKQKLKNLKLDDDENIKYENGFMG